MAFVIEFMTMYLIMIMLKGDLSRSLSLYQSSSIHIHHERRSSDLWFDERLDSCMRLALVVVVVHVRFRFEHCAGYERVTLRPRIIVRLVRTCLFNVSFTVLRFPLGHAVK